MPPWEIPGKVGEFDEDLRVAALNINYAGFPHLLESPEIFFFKIHSGTWKVLENHFGPGKSWKLKFKVLESPGKISLKITH